MKDARRLLRYSGLAGTLCLPGLANAGTATSTITNPTNPTTSTGVDLLLTADLTGSVTLTMATRNTSTTSTDYLGGPSPDGEQIVFGTVTSNDAAGFTGPGNAQQFTDGAAYYAKLRVDVFYVGYDGASVTFDATFSHTKTSAGPDANAFYLCTSTAANNGPGTEPVYGPTTAVFAVPVGVGGVSGQITTGVAFNNAGCYSATAAQANQVVGVNADVGLFFDHQAPTGHYELDGTFTVTVNSAS